MTVGYFLYVIGDYAILLVLWILGVFGLILTISYGVVITIADEVGITEYIDDKTTEIADKLFPVLINKTKLLGRSIKEPILLLFVRTKEVIHSDRVTRYKRRIGELLSRFVCRCIYFTAKWGTVFSREIRYVVNVIFKHIRLREKMRSLRNRIKEIKRRRL